MNVTLSPLAGAGWQFFDNNGVPLAGGLLYTYAAGTSTPQATYTSAYGNIANANPIVLDSAGRVPQEIWLLVGYNYKFILHNSNDVLIRSWDNIPSSLPPPVANDAANINYEIGYNPTPPFVAGVGYKITSLGNTDFVAIGATVNQVGQYFIATGPGSGTGTAEVSRTVQNKFQEWVSVKDFGAKGDGSSDDTDAIQAAIDYCIKQYDPTETTMDGNNVQYIWQQKTLFFPTGKYQILGTLNLSFRNNWRIVGEDQWNSCIWYNPPTVTNGIILNCECSNYMTIENLTLNGGFKADTFIYASGNGVNATGAKGNSTGNLFQNIYFWCQAGSLTGTEYWPDQYDPLTAMLCCCQKNGSGSSYNPSYNSMDDSYILNCRFAPNSLANKYAMAFGSGFISANDNVVFGANGVLIRGGGSGTFEDNEWLLYGPHATDGTENHAAFKYYSPTLNNSNVTVIAGYMESGSYYGNGTSAGVAYAAQTSTTDPNLMAIIQSLYINGGIWSVQEQNKVSISIGTGVRGNVKINNAILQGGYSALIYAPLCSVEIINMTAVTATTPIVGGKYNYMSWQPIAYNSVRNELSSSYFSVTGERLPAVNVTIDTDDWASKLIFSNLDTALSFISNTSADVVLTLNKNASITLPAKLNGKLTICINDKILTVTTTSIENHGTLVITNHSGDEYQGGQLLGSTNGIINYGNMLVKNVVTTSAIAVSSGTLALSNAVLSGSASNVAAGGTGICMIDTTTTFSGTGEVVYLNSALAQAIVIGGDATTPTTGKWMRGTEFRNIYPVSGAPNRWFATSTGVGALANWKNAGNLS